MRADAVDPDLPTTNPVTSLPAVLNALSDPIRLEMVRRLAAADEPVACTRLYDGIAKSTASSAMPRTPPSLSATQPNTIEPSMPENDITA